jgi:hypothetical protein
MRLLTSTDPATVIALLTLAFTESGEDAVRHTIGEAA